MAINVVWGNRDFNSSVLYVIAVFRRKQDGM